MKNNYLYILLTVTLIYSCSSGPDRPVNNPLFDDGYFVTWFSAKRCILQYKYVLSW